MNSNVHNFPKNEIKRNETKQLKQKLIPRNEPIHPSDVQLPIQQNTLHRIKSINQLGN